MRISWRPPKQSYFNPRSPRGGATTSAATAITADDIFQSTLPTRGSDVGMAPAVENLMKNFNPRSPRGGATRYELLGRDLQYISIHAPHEGERLLAGSRRKDQENFNPRSPRGGATSSRHTANIRRTGFQSTLPTRGSDSCRPSPVSYIRHFNPRSPRGGATRPEHIGLI